MTRDMTLLLSVLFTVLFATGSFGAASAQGTVLYSPHQAPKVRDSATGFWCPPAPMILQQAMVAETHTDDPGVTVRVFGQSTFEQRPPRLLVGAMVWLTHRIINFGASPASESVEVLSRTAPFMAFSDELGFATLRVEPGVYRMQVGAVGYAFGVGIIRSDPQHAWMTATIDQVLLCE